MPLQAAGPILPTILLLASVLSCAAGQSRSTSGDLIGIVRDESQAVVPGARITAIKIDTNLERVAISGPDGRFTVPALSPGGYRVNVELASFSTHVLELVEVQLGSSTDVEIVLKVATLTERVTVAGNVSAVDAERSVVSSIVSLDQIAELPINRRNFISFSLITPGIIADRMANQGATATSGLSFAGQRARSNNITVDGLDNNDETIGSVRATFSQEAVQEFQVLTQSYSAEFGKASGGVLNIVTRSGTNVLAGAAFIFFRDDVLNAKEYFEQFDPSGNAIDRPKAAFRQTQYGGFVSGPIKKNRTFFFGAVERLDIAANNFVTIDDTTIVSVLGRPVGTPAEILRRAGFAIDTGHVPYDVRSNQVLMKLDHNVRPTQTLTVRYNYGAGYNANTESWGGLIAKSRGAALDNSDHMIAVSYSAILTPRLVNEARFQLAARSQQLLSLDPTCSDECDRNDEGGPTIEVAGVASAGRHRLTPQLRDNVRYQALETVSYQRGKHLFKAGIDFNVVDHTTSSLPLQFGGRYIFAPLPAVPGLLPEPIDAIQAVALGLPAAYVQGYGNPDAAYLTSDVSLFVQDQWRAGPALTLQGGLRYQTQFWPARDYSVPGYGSYGIPGDRNNFAPRIAVTWVPRATRRESLHAAYGVYYDNIISGIVGIADVIDGTADGVRTLVTRFPLSIPAWNAPGRQLPEPATAYPSLIIPVSPDLRTSYSHQVSAGVDRELWPRATASADVLRVRGLKHLGVIDYNPLVASLGPGRRPEDIDGRPGTSASILQYTAYADISYTALVLSVRQRSTRGAQFLASYTWSKTTDNSSDFQNSFIPEINGRGRDPNRANELPLGFDPAHDRGASQQDQQHRFVLSGSMDWKGLQLAGIVTVGSGVPFNILAGADLNADGDGGTFPPDRARRNPADPATAVPRNSGRMPSESTVDFRISRRFRLRGSAAIVPMFEVFNLFNRVNFTDVNNIFGPGAFPDNPLSTYGQFLRAAPLRQVQLAARIVF
jgi:Carboxypeptidase regulatory-like domain/TonB dependent receptor